MCAMVKTWPMGSRFADSQRCHLVMVIQPVLAIPYHGYILFMDRWPSVILVDLIQFLTMTHTNYNTYLMK